MDADAGTVKQEWKDGAPGPEVLPYMTGRNGAFPTSPHAQAK